MFVETKLRRSTNLTENQKIVYKALEEGTARAVGDNAVEAGFKEGQQVKATIILVNKFND